MNDLNSLLIATTVLAIGGLGFYMYKNDQGGFNSEEYLDHEFDNLEEDLENDDESSVYSSSSEEEEEDESNKKNKTRRNSNGNSRTKKKRN
jgi:hypothetical protein